MVQHEDGRQGIAYHNEQSKAFQDLKKVLVNWMDGKKTLAAIDKLKRIGFVD